MSVKSGQNPDVPKDKTVEQVLESLRSIADIDTDRYKQLAAVRYYLHVMLWKCQDAWRGKHVGITNYSTLLDQIEEWRKRTFNRTVCLVTFNYDTMIEDALAAAMYPISSVSDYIASSNYKLIKFHGSVHWARRVTLPIKINREPWEVVNELIERAQQVEQELGGYEMVNLHPIAIGEDGPLFPPLAVPFENQKKWTPRS